MKSATRASLQAGTRKCQKYGNRLNGMMQTFCIAVAVMLGFALDLSSKGFGLRMRQPLTEEGHSHGGE